MASAAEMLLVEIPGMEILISNLYCLFILSYSTAYERGCTAMFWRLLMSVGGSCPIEVGREIKPAAEPGHKKNRMARLNNTFIKEG